MKRFRAILLILLYAGFSSSFSGAHHQCKNECPQGNASHEAIQDNQSARECSEKETSVNGLTEHRVERTVRLARKNTFPGFAALAHPAFSLELSSGKNYSNPKPPSVTISPLYIRHRAFLI